MCGLAGIVTRQGNLPDEGMLRRMSDAIAHRGPDSDGMWLQPGVGLAHRRLAIIDLNPTGAQPMHSVGKELTIVFNGEIYNFQDLRVELEKLGARFASTSDTEVILEAYRAWGTECLKKFRGMFAFALWDAPRKKLLLARDRIGKKPLFYSFTTAHDLVFASELKALATVVPMKPDWDAIRLFLGLQYVPSPRTGFHEVLQLEPGQFGVWDEHGWKIGRYNEWETKPFESTPTVSEMNERIRSLLDDAVRLRQLAADVPVGAFLSGGIDSAAVVALATKHVSRPLQTFTMGFDVPEMDERAEAREIARYFNTEHHEFVAKPDDLLLLVDDLVKQYDAPYADSSALPLWLLSKQTVQQVKVVLTGDGGDEVFGGYRRYAAYESALRVFAAPLLPSVVPFVANQMGSLFHDVRYERMAETVEALKLKPETAYGELFCGSYFSSKRLQEAFDPDFLKKTDHDDAVHFIASRMEGFADLDRAMFFDLTSYLPDDLNVKMDRATMRWGLEARAPFLDQELVSYVLRLPLKEKVDRGKKKIALKRAMRDLLPAAVLDRPKRGFQVPLAAWFRGALEGLVRERCLGSGSPLAAFMKPGAIDKLLAENAAGADHGNRLWMLLSLSTWLSQYA